MAALAVIASAALTTPVLAAETYTTEMVDQKVTERVREMQFQAERSRNTTWQTYTADQRFEDRLSVVMKLNKETREQAIKRMTRAVIWQSGQMGLMPTSPYFFLPYNAGTNTFQNPLTRHFYAGFDPATERFVTTPEKRAEVNENFWYCDEGERFTYTEEKSECVAL